MKKCPFMLMSNSYTTTVCNHDCAWFDSELQECAVLSIAKFLSAVEEQMTVANLKRDNYEDIVRI